MWPWPRWVSGALGACSPDDPPGRRPRGDVDNRAAAQPHVGQRVEQQHNVGVALPVMLRHVQRAQAQGSAPVDVSDVIARGEWADVTRLDALALRR